MSNLPALSLLETRVVGVLVEKQHTVPDTYPLTLNSLVSGCNQKTSRDPVIEASEADVQAVIDHLKSLSLVVESSGGRVMRYAHNAGKVFNLPGQSVALLAVLFLRGPQTPGELRINSDRLYKFGDISSVEGFLDELAERGFVKVLPRQPGSREARWAHLMSGEAAIPASASAPEPASGGGEAMTMGEISALKANFDHLQSEVDSLKETVAKLCKELGIK
jgi:uncharacterized protein YceH (UPF0502 family)